MSHIVSSRRWRWMLFAALGAGAGYATYRLYTSEEIRRKRHQLARLFGALFLFGDAAQQSAESMALISADLKRFLLSDDNELPRSLRQALKLAHSPDFQHSCTVLSAALTRGLIRGFSSPRPHTPRPSPSVDDSGCTDIKEICLISSVDPTGSQKGRMQRIERSERYTGSKMIGPNVYLDKARQQSERKPYPEDFPERLLSKLFSDPGVNFASAVVGNAAHTLVQALLDGFQNQSVVHSSGSEERDTSSKLINVLCTQQCKELINECIQTLVNTTVSVYIDKTKDVNFYNDMVAGITNPSHKDPMKDLLTTVCNGAVETLVKSSHSVMFAKKSGQPDSKISLQDFPMYAVEELSNGDHMQSQMSLCTPATSCADMSHCQGGRVSNDGSVSSSSGSTEMSGKSQQEHSGINNLIDGVSKTLAIPSNHRLVVDVAGTMTSEAVRSFVNVIVSTISNNLHDKVQRGWGRVKGSALEQVGAFQAQTTYKDVAIKAFFLASICLAICLHMLTTMHIENV